MSTRIRRREYGLEKEFKLYSDDTHVKPRVVNRISGERGEEMVKAKEAIRVESDGGKIIAYQMCIRPPRAQEIVERCPNPTSAAFSRAEVDAIAFSGFRDGRSRTASMSATERAARVRSGRRAEDLVERSMQKLAVYKNTH